MTPPSPQPASSVWHPGERTLQDTVGAAEQMEQVGQRVVRPYLLDQHREFFSNLPVVVLGSVDDDGDAWATLLAGKPGFLSSPSPDTLRIDLRRDPTDPAHRGTHFGDAIGLLGIDLHTRRRNRLNGRVHLETDGAVNIKVEQSFGNCPQYIQQRSYSFSRDPQEPFNGAIYKSTTIDDAARRIIGEADTFFVASYFDGEGGHRQVDVSHRGGRAGFVEISDHGSLTIPDFSGNLFFATLGNILINHKASLVFVDFASGDLLHLCGEAEVILRSPEIAAYQGAERLWRFFPRKVVRRSNALPLRWTFEDHGWSQNSLMTGDWAQARKRIRAAELSAQWRSFRITRIVTESASIRSFHLEPTDDRGLAIHQAGQHLPIRIRPTDEEQLAIRNYSLSVAPSDGFYRISIKREGLVSQYLHGKARVGDVIEVRGPEGSFTIDPHEPRPVALLAGGVGITPLLAMLRHLVYEGLRTNHIRRTLLVQAAHSMKERAFDQELASLAKSAQGTIRIVRVLGDVDGAKKDVDYDGTGHIDMAMLSNLLVFEDNDFYLCGPPSFMQALYAGLRQRNVADSRIYAETFGMSPLLRMAKTSAPPLQRAPTATQPVQVVFTDSAKEALWRPESGTLLDLAESRGLAPVFSCRKGECGTCHTKLLSGCVTYIREPVAHVPEGEVLLCCSTPSAPSGQEDNRILLAL